VNCALNLRQFQAEFSHLANHPKGSSIAAVILQSCHPVTFTPKILQTSLPPEKKKSRTRQHIFLTSKGAAVIQQKTAI